MIMQSWSRRTSSDPPEVLTPLAHGVVEASGEALNDCLEVRALERAPQLLVGEAPVGVEVETQRSGEEHGVLCGPEGRVAGCQYYDLLCQDEYAAGGLIVTLSAG